jgi:peptidylprolyl isomerase
MKRHFVASAAVSIILLAAAGCAPKPDESATPAPEATPAPAAGPAASPSPSGDVTMGPPAPPSAPDPTAGSGLPPFQSSGKVQKTASGLQYDDMTVGSGPQPKDGQNVIVHYIGTLEDGTKFDASYDRGQPIDFPLGVGKVIPGWDEGIASMKVGGRRKLIIPGDLAYGPNPPPGAPIPPNATLIFDVTLVGVSEAPKQ